VAAALATNNEKPARVSNLSSRWRRIIGRTRQERQEKRSQMAKTRRPEKRTFSDIYNFLERFRFIANYAIRSAPPSDALKARQARRDARVRLFQSSIRHFFRSRRKKQ
jgi:hypothetical protein